MKNSIFVIAMLAFGTISASAQVYKTYTGKITFDATTHTSPEKIAAVNNEVSCILDAGKGDLIFQLPVKSFKFKNGLMEEHFNENYFESGKFTKSDFKGKITNISQVNINQDGEYNVTVAGDLNIHGAKRSVNVPGQAIVEGTKLTLKTTFKAKLNDYAIKIPSLVGDKVAEEATVTVDVELHKK